MKVFVANYTNINERLEILALPYVTFDEENRLLQKMFKNKNNSQNQKNAEVPQPVCEWYGVYENSFDPNTGQTEKTLLYTIKICDDNWDWNGGGGNSGGGTGTGGYTNTTIDDKINKDNLDACTKSILEEIQSGKSIENIINQFADKNSDFNWTIETANTTSEATTDWLNSTSNAYITQIDPDFINSATKTSIARTVIHEAIHAYILSYIDIAKNGDPELSLKEFPDLWNDLVAKKYGDPNSVSGWNKYHHEEMARNYINIVSNAISIWDGNKNSNEYYRDLAWGGLLGTQIFQSSSDISNSDRIRIKNVNLAEDTNSDTAKGIPCN